MKKLLLMLIGAMMGIAMHAQNISGTVVDASSGDPVIGATVLIKGSSIGTITDVDGKFSINNTLSGTRQLEIGFLGYQTMLMSINSESGDLGTISLGQGIEGLEEVVVTGTMDIVRDRRTPVAVSTITASEIQRKAVGNVELTEVAKATPSIFIANQAGGYGDSEVWTRGFDQSNTAFLLNGQPINGMEDGKMYWSNWSGLTDVASAVQIQRGLGASKLAISSVGGTWNFVMKATDNVEGGSLFSTMGNNGFKKGGVSYSTGLNDKGFAISVLASAWSGNGYAYGTRGQGQTYFLSAGYKPSEKHSINFLVTGAPQWHDQKFQTSIYSHENEDGDIDRRYNSNWGIYDGQYFSERRNYYHKPVINLNWDWKIDDKSDFAMVLYGSFGRGGGTGGIGGSKVRTESGLINFDATAALPDSVSGYVRRASVNNHNWFGSVLKYQRKINNNINVSVGADLRRYYGDHFRQVESLLGRDNYTQSFSVRYPNGVVAANEYKADPWAALSDFADRDERIAYNNAETIRYAGLFGQVEYATDKFSAYLQGAVSTQDHVRHEFYWAELKDEDSETVVNNGYNAKIGVSYLLADEHTVFANAGQYSRQPFHDVIFEGNSNVLTANLSNETITGFELGYKYQSSMFFANINGYFTRWEDRILQNFLNADEGEIVQLTDGSDYVAVDDPYENVLQNQVHTGVELDLGVNVNSDLSFKGFASIGNWEVEGDRSVDLLDETPRRVIKSYDASGDNIKVGGAPQTSFGLGGSYNISKNLSTELQYFYYANLYARNGGIELPSYGVFDLNVAYTMPLDNGHLIRFIGNVYNVLDELYISKSRTSTAADPIESNNWNGINKSNQVTFGKGRTWNFTMKYSF
jgi:hypothetical protein